MLAAENNTTSNNTQERSTRKNNIINICYASDKNYAKYLALSIATVLDSKNFDDKINFYILDGGLTEKDRRNILSLKKISDCEINFISIDNKIFSDCTLGICEHISSTAYYRLLISNLLPDIDRIIYLDCDVQVKSSLNKLFNTNLEENIIGAVPDRSCDKLSKHWNIDCYYNSGVLLLDLDKLRKIKFTDDIQNYIHKYNSELLYPDQDILNIYFAGKIKTLEPEWNMQIFSFSKEYKKYHNSTKIFHYITGDKEGLVFNKLPLVFKTGYKTQLLWILIQKLPKLILQWIFMIRRSDATTKDITLLGFRFEIKVPLKNKREEQSEI